MLEAELVTRADLRLPAAALAALPAPPGRRIGFVSTRLAGTDGVSLEARKWAAVLQAAGHQCFYFAGESDHDADCTYTVAEATFRHPAVSAVCAQAFGQHHAFADDYSPDHHELHRSNGLRQRTPAMTRRIQEQAAHLKAELYRYAGTYDLELLVVENALSIPMHLPLGVALTEFIAETGLPTIAHHHDFFWERKRFQANCVADYLEMAFPPRLPTVRHVVINSLARQQLAWRKGLASVLIPNVMDFEHPPAVGRGAALRTALGLGADELLVLQPTRVVQRKGIEHAIELVRRLERPACLVISHASGDEGETYAQRLREFAQLLGVRLILADGLVGAPGEAAQPFSLADAYAAADLVTFPSLEEGFGNAFLEAVYYGRPLVVNNYLVYDVDIKPLGFRVIEFEDYLTACTLRAVQAVLNDPARAQEMAQANYELGRRHFSYAVLERRLRRLVADLLAQA